MPQWFDDDDDCIFAEALARHGVYVLPGSLMEIPGHFRVSLAASLEMLERSLPTFAATIHEG